MVEPSALFIFQLQDAMEMMTKRSMIKSSTIAQKSPLLLTATGARPWMAEYISHGMGSLLKQHRVKGRETKTSLSWVASKYGSHCKKQTIAAHPTVMSKMLLPTELDTAMSPMPLRATITLVMRSGMEVPAAKIVRPMISSEIPMVSPTYRMFQHEGNLQFTAPFI